VVSPSDEQLTRRDDPWRVAWNLLSGDALLAIALLGIALLLALSAWLPQAPNSVTAPVAYSRWLGETQLRFGSTFALLRQIEFFSLERSLVLRALIALATLCLIVRWLASLHTGWAACRSPLPLPLTAQKVATEKSLDGIAAALERRRFRVVREGDELRADRFPLAVVGRIVVYTGALLVVAGFLISNIAGWRASDLTLGVGQMVPVGHGLLYNLRLDALDQANVGHISFVQETDVVGEGNLSPEHPLQFNGLEVLVRGSGPAIRATATLTDGQSLRLQASATSSPVTELVLLLTRDEPDRYLAAPEAGLVVRLSRLAGAMSVRAQVYRSLTGAVVFDGDIPADGQVRAAEGVIFALKAEPYAVLDIMRDPGQPVTLTGAIVLALGLAIASLWPVRRLAAGADAGGTWVSGDTDFVLTFSPTPARARLKRWLTSKGWQIGLAVLSALVAVVIARSLLRAGMLWPSGSTASAFLSAWLIGCATAVLPHRALRAITLMLAVVALIVIVIWPGLALTPGTYWVLNN
jgi:hypothetical protein